VINSRRTLIRGARQLLTMRGPSGPRRGADLGQLNIIEDGCVLVEDGRILEVGPSRRVENLAAARYADELPAAGCVVLPAFVDADTGSLLAPTTRIQLAGPRAMAESERTLAAMAVHGTLAVETKAHEPRVARMLGRLHSPVDVAPTLLADVTAPAAIRDRNIADYIEGSLTGDSDVDALVATRLEQVREAGFRIRASARNGGAAVLASLARRGLAAAVDLRGLQSQDVACLALFNTVAVLTPGVVFHSRSDDYPPARDLIAHGAAVAIATGYSPEANPTYSMSAAIGLACRQMGLAPSEALAGATINAACALGIQHRTGSLEPGKQADILILNTPDYRAVAWALGVNLVSVVMRRGEIVYRAGGLQWKGR
jgi:imidazolonepropionase